MKMRTFTKSNFLFFLFLLPRYFNFQTSNANLSSPVAVANSTEQLQQQQHQYAQIVHTRDLFEHLFPNIPSINDKNLDYDVWLSKLEAHLEQYLSQKEQLNSNKLTSNRTVANGNHQYDATDNNSNSAVNRGDSDDEVDDDDKNNAQQHSIAARTEELILQNAKLKTTVDEYKSIVAETVSRKSFFDYFFFFFCIFC